MLTSLKRLPREPWLLTAASLVILAAAPAQYLGRQHDDLLFVVASHALSYGRYVLFTSPGFPSLNHVWPGLPALLLPVTWAAGERLAAYQLWAALVLAACPWALWWWLRRRTAPSVALLIPLVFAASPLVLSQSGCVMTEAPHALLAAVLLWLLEAPRLDAGKAGWTLLALVLSRPAALSLVPAAAARCAAERRWKEAARLLGPGAAACAAWMAWCRWSAGGVQEAGEWAASYRGPGLRALVELPAANARFFLDALGSSLLPPGFAGGGLAWALGLVVAGAAALGAWRLWRRKPSDPAVLMLVAAAVMHAFWGWRYERYLLPLLPLILCCLAAAAGARAPAVLGALLACQLMFQTPRFLGRSPVSTPELAATYAWLRDHARPTDVLASPLYVRDGYYAGLPSLPLADADDAQALAALSRRWHVRFILWQDLDLGLTDDAGADPRRRLAHVERLLEDRGRFRPVFVDEPGRGRLYEVLTQAD